jgi:hypothetical protein
MPLPESYWPRKKLGELSPTTTVIAYEWYYFSIPRGVSTVALPVGMEEFTPKEIQRVFAPAADYARTLAKHGGPDRAGRRATALRDGAGLPR